MIAGNDHHEPTAGPDLIPCPNCSQSIPAFESMLCPECFADVCPLCLCSQCTDMAAQAPRRGRLEIVHNPSPIELAEMRLEIQLDWSERERKTRLAFQGNLGPWLVPDVKSPGRDFEAPDPNPFL